MHLLNTLPQRLDPGATPTFADLISATLTSPASTNLTLTSGLVGTNKVNFPDTLTASSSTAGAVTIGNGTAATNVAIGGGKVNIGDTTAGSSGAGALVVAGGISAGNSGSAASYFGGAVTAPSLTAPASIDLTLAGGSSGASLVLGQGASGVATFGGANRSIALGTWASATGMDAGEALFAFNLIGATGQTFKTPNSIGAGGGYGGISFGSDGVTGGVIRFFSSTAATTAGATITPTEVARFATSTGDFRIASSTAGSSGAGALVVTGGLSAGGASYFTSGVTVIAGSSNGFGIGRLSNATTYGAISFTPPDFNSVTMQGMYAGGGSSTYITAPTSTILQASGVSILTAKSAGVDVIGALSTTGAATFAGAVTTANKFAVSAYASNSFLTGNGSGFLDNYYNGGSGFDTMSFGVNYDRRNNAISSAINSTGDMRFEVGTGGQTNFVVALGGTNTAPTDKLTIASTGAATFAGAVTVAMASPEFSIRSTSDAAAQRQYLTFGSPNYNRAQFQSVSAGTNDGSLELRTFNAGAQTLSQTWNKDGSSTFAGAVTVGGALNLNNLLVEYNVANSPLTLSNPADAGSIKLTTGSSGGYVSSLQVIAGNASVNPGSIMLSPSQAGSVQLLVRSSAPTYVKGAIYFDSTLNKLRVGGATAWETITSV